MKVKVKVIYHGSFVGYVPNKLSKIITCVLVVGGKVETTVTRRQEHKNNNGALEIPCRYNQKVFFFNHIFNVKGRQSPEFALFFNLRNRISF